ncbi:GNAT family N-acetyltransferase [Hyella patelloides LEGE 07179]|uniref:GNAT family N-acetyltransferase n=1 Tax=Hyella patelloides LEGE 07179 TaxID=945734 RepID=A0A563VWM3_9CYAN|nr:GNAT family N-acetyltransferase [Hyella patelloides]VEP15858.1 GNAT family N-acetyltransferase [Hyella patelloides LEGE 07179]
MAICIREIYPDELEWVNQQYDSIGFVATDLSSRQFIAISDRQKAGLGRLVYIDNEVWELGGIYVLPKFRGQSVARKIVQHLLLQANYEHLYCIPFTNLGNFYKGMGFVECSNSSKIPEKIKQKYQWCQHTYSQGVLLLEIALS